MAIATLSIDLEAKLARLQQDLDKAGRLAEKNAEQMRAAYLRTGSVVSGLGKTIAGAFAGFSVVEFIKGNATAIDALNDVSDATGASIESISALEQVALRTGTNLETVGGILVKFNKALSEGNPNGPLTQTLKSIGLNAEELRRMDPAEALRAVARALAGFADDGNKARIIQELFGKSVKEAAPFLKDLSENGTLNAKVTAQQAEEAEKFNKQLFQLQTNSANAARELTSKLLPALNGLFDKVNKKGVGGTLLEMLGFDDKWFDTKKMAEAGAKVRELASERDRLQEWLRADASNADTPARQNRLRQIVEVELPYEIAAYKATVAELKGLNVPQASYSNEGRNKPKPSAPDLPQKPDAAALQEQQRYENLIKKVKERLDISKAELAIGEKLTESEKLRIDVMAELGSAKLSEPHKRAVKALLDQAVASGKLREEQVELLKARAGSLAIEQRADQAQAQRIDGLISETQSMREANEEIGLTVRQVEELRIKRMQANLTLEKESLFMALNADASATDIANRKQVIALLERQIELRRAGTEKAQAIAESPTKGAEAALEGYYAKVRDVGTATRDAVATSMESADSVLTDFFKTGQLNAGRFAETVIAQILRITAVQPLVNYGASIIGTALGLTIPGKSALGNAFDPSGKVTAFAQGGVVDRATPFTYGGGQQGVMGEAGPEGVLPLKRGADGRLGVIAHGAGRTVVNNYNTYNVGSGITRSEVMSAMQTLAESLMARTETRLARAGVR